MPTQEGREGPTPRGGVRSVMYYLDADGKPCPKEEAVAAEAVEYDKDGDAIARTYLTRQPDPRSESSGPHGPPPFPGAVFDPGRHRWVRGGGSGDAGQPLTHADLPYLPKDPKRLTIDQAERGLKDHGYTVLKTLPGTGHPDDPATVHVKGPDGKEEEMTPTQIKVVLYGDAALPKAARLGATDLARLHRQAGAGRLLGPAKTDDKGKVTRWRVEDPDGGGVKEVPDAEVRAAVVKAKLAREGAEGVSPSAPPKD
jgi:hypothetical protein